MDASSDGPTHIAIATTRPETMLGDTAVAIHPQPAEALDQAIRTQQQKVREASDKDRGEAEQELERLQARVTEVLPTLVKIVEFAKAG